MHRLGTRALLCRGVDIRSADDLTSFLTFMNTDLKRRAPLVQRLAICTDKSAIHSLREDHVSQIVQILESCTYVQALKVYPGPHPGL